MRERSKRWILLAVIGFALIYKFALLHSVTLGYLKTHRLQWDVYRHAHPFSAAMAFCAIYIALTSISFPGATILTLLAGSLFGLWVGLFLASFAATIGATIAFLLARSVFRKLIEDKYRFMLKKLRAGVARNEIAYLLSLRLNPVVPFWLINLLMGLTSIRPWRYYWVSQVGMIPGAILYVNAGTRLAQLNSLHDIMTPAVLIAFLLLAIFPLAARFVSIKLFPAEPLPVETHSSDRSRT